MKRFLLALFLLFPSIAFAQTQRNPCYYTSANPGPDNGCIPVSSANPLPTVNSGVSSNSYTPLTPMQNALAVASSTALTIPSGATYANICAEGQSIRFTTDGTTTPTSSIGMLLQINQCVALSGTTTLSNFRAIQTAATATIDVNYFK